MNESEWLACDDPQQMLEYANATPFVSTRKLRLFACACVRQAWHLLDDGARRNVECGETLAESPSDTRNGTHAAFMSESGIADILGDISDSKAACFAAHWCCGQYAGDVALQVSRWLQQLPPLQQASLLRDIVGNPFRPVFPLTEHQNTDGFRRRHALALGQFTIFATSWLTPDVLSLAQAAYDDRKEDTKRWTCNNAGTHSHPGKAGAMAHGVFHARNPRALHHHHDEKCSFVMEGKGHLDPTRLAILADALEDAGCDSGDLLRHLRGQDYPAGPHYLVPQGPHFRGCWAVDLILGKE